MISFPTTGTASTDIPDPRWVGAVRDRQRERAHGVRPADRPAAARAGRTVPAARCRGDRRWSAPRASTGSGSRPFGDDTLGALVVQTYEPASSTPMTTFALTFVGQHIGSALSRVARIGRGASARRRARDRERGGPGPRETARLRVDHGSGRPRAAEALGPTGCRSRCSIRRSARRSSCTGSPKASGEGARGQGPR